MLQCFEKCINSFAKPADTPVLAEAPAKAALHVPAAAPQSPQSPDAITDPLLPSATSKAAPPQPASVDSKVFTHPIIMTPLNTFVEGQLIGTSMLGGASVAWPVASEQAEVIKWLPLDDTNVNHLVHEAARLHELENEHLVPMRGFVFQR